MKRLLMITLMVVAISGCKKTPKNSANSNAADGVANKQFTLVEGVSGVFGVKGLKAFEDTAGSLVSVVNPALQAQVGPQVEKGLQSLLGTSSLLFLEQDKPMYLVGLKGAKKAKDGLPKMVPALFVPIKDIKVFNTALPQGKTAMKGQKNAYKYKVLDGSSVYVTTVGKTAIFVFDDPSVMKRAVDYLPVLKLYKVNKPLRFTVKSAILMPIIEKAFAQTTKKMKPNPGISTLKKEMALLKDLLSQTRDFGMDMDYVNNNLVFGLQMNVKKGSDLSELAKGSVNDSFKLAAKMPANGWIVAVSNVKLDKLSEKWAQLGIETWKQLLGLTKEETKELSALYKKMIELNDGKSAFSMFDKDGFPFSAISISGTKNGKQMYDALRTLMGKVASRLLTKAITLAKTDEEKKLLTGLNLTSVKDFVSSANQITNKKGVALTYSTFNKDGYQGELLTAKIDYNKLTPDPKTQQQLKSLHNLALDQVGVAWGYKKDALVFAFGKSPIALIQDAEKASASDAFLKKVLNSYKGKAFTAGYLSFGKLVDVIVKAVPAAGALVQGLSGQDKLVVSFVLGTKGPEHITGFINIPYDDIAQALKRFGPLLQALGR